jgi:hypothetical protein
MSTPEPEPIEVTSACAEAWAEAVAALVLLVVLAPTLAPLLPVLLPAVMEETPVTMDEALAGADQVESDRGAET